MTRTEEIYDIILKHGRLKVVEIMEMTGYTNHTIRTALTKLAHQDKIIPFDIRDCNEKEYGLPPNMIRFTTKSGKVFF